MQLKWGEKTEKEKKVKQKEGEIFEKH